MATVTLQDALVPAAAEILDDLERTAGADGGWMAEVVVGVEDDRAVVGTGDVGPSLYDGTAGIALVLAAAGRRDVAAAATRHALAAGEQLLAEGRLGLFDGAAGIALTAVRTGELLDDDELVAAGRGLSDEVAARPPGADHDLIGGAAGTTLALLELDRVPAAARLARHLVVVAQPQAWGVAWPSSTGVPMLGLGHGAAGVALALAEVGTRTGDDRLLSAAAAGVAYERGWFDAATTSWPDLRAGEREPGRMAAWCHGALGIGLSRLRLHALTTDPLATGPLVAEVSAALQGARDVVVTAGTALREGVPTDCSACHGLTGAVELLLLAGRALGVDDHVRAARRVAGLLLEQRRQAGRWPCGLVGAGEVPGLMTGTAGIALTLLRVAGAVELPSPLLPGTARW